MASCSMPVKIETEVESTMAPNWLELPRDVTAKILKKLSVVEIVTSACLVCPLWWNIFKDPFMWRTIDMTNLSRLRYDLVKICCYLVDQSCGHVEDISIQYFGTDKLLKYIADRTSNLRRIQLVNCWAISDEVMSEVVKKFPLLEELDISSCILSEDSLEVVGRFCPLLKTLKFNMKSYYTGNKCDDEAFVIATNMPKLRQLQLIGNELSNDGLVAILDGCPLLESLDLRNCYYVDLHGSLRKRCLEQIEDLRCSNEYLAEFDDDNNDGDYFYNDDDIYIF